MAVANQYAQQTLAGKKVVLSGGTAGIGRAIARLLVSEGARVLTFGRDEHTIADALKDLEPAAQRGGGCISILHADHADINDVKRVFAEADRVLGPLDILINNAAIGVGGVSETDLAETEYALKTNVLGYLACAHEAIARMQPRGDGHIVNIGSMSADEKGAGGDIYVASKSAIRGFSASLRKQLSQHNIKVSLIEPGLVGSDMTAKNIPPSEQPGRIAEGKMLMAEDIAECVRYVLVQPKRCSVLTVQIEPVHSN